ALAAIDGPLAVILGGKDKGALWDELAAAVAARGASAVVLGETAEVLARALAGQRVEAQRAGTMDAAVAMALKALPGSGTVLLSPACASFDLFRGFEHRGECFAAAARTASAR
nr:UDP-N-acetylmuramoyl-L-alanine--D-glutamate ligase [Planctomycetota bacterium]